MASEIKHRLTPLQTEIINIAKIEGSVTPEKVLRRYDITYWTVKMNLNKMQEKGLLKRVHEKKLKFKIK